MEQLAKKDCEAGRPRLREHQIDALMTRLKGWEQVSGPKIFKTFIFKNFKEALDFTIDVGALAEEEDHHPEIRLSWGKVEVYIWSEDHKGLTENDFILAAKIDSI